MRERIEATLERFGVHFDRWSSERELHRDATRFRRRSRDLRTAATPTSRTEPCGCGRATSATTRIACSIRSDGEPTYFATDIAYHRDKLERGAEQMIVPLGADHHGYVPRMKAAVGMLSGDPDRYEAPIMQFVQHR